MIRSDEEIIEAIPDGGCSGRRLAVALGLGDNSGAIHRRLSRMIAGYADGALLTAR